MAEAVSMVQGWYDNRAAQIWGVAAGVVWWLIDPTMASAFTAIWVLVGFDFLTKLVALSAQHGGFVNAIRMGAIRSETAFRRTFVKILGYFILMAVVGMARHLVYLSLPARALEALAYGFLFMVEAISITENLVAAGLTQLAPLLLRFERERDKLLDKNKDTEREAETGGKQ